MSNKPKKIKNNFVTLPPKKPKHRNSMLRAIKEHLRNKYGKEVIND